jgi:Pyridoxamine 5'-phosphate oxidase/Response regulator receiver domain
MRILVAEDDAGLGAVLVRGLREQGYVVDLVPDGETAATYLKFYQYEVAVIDWRMPRLSGLDGSHLGQVTCEDVQVGAADGGRVDPDDDIGLCAHVSFGDFLPGLVAGTVVNESAHGFLRSLSCRRFQLRSGAAPGAGAEGPDKRPEGLVRPDPCLASVVTGPTRPAATTRREHTMADRVIEELDENECLYLISPGGVGRIAYTGRFGPAVLPVNYTVRDGAVIFRTAEARTAGRGPADRDRQRRLRGGVRDRRHRHG